MATEYDLERGKGVGRRLRVLGVVVVCVVVVAVISSLAVVIGMWESQTETSCENSCHFNQTFNETTCKCMCGDGYSGEFCQFPPKGDIIVCPKEKGYQSWVYSDAVYCLKYRAVELTQPDARMMCEDDGGNLALIDSDSKRLRLHTIYEELVGPTDGEDIWFDGYDIDDNNRFMTWKGDLLPESQWRKGQPQDKEGEVCVVARWEHAFLLRDYKCKSSTLQFFCEIELY